MVKYALISPCFLGFSEGRQLWFDNLPLNHFGPN